MKCTPIHASTKTCCYFCGGVFHNRRFCPAREQKCHNCGKRGHFAEVCRSECSVKSSTSATVSSDVYKQPQHPMLATTNSDSPCCAGPPSCLEPAVVDACVEGHPLEALLDSGASENYIDKKLVDHLKLDISKEECDVTMASTKLLLKTEGRVKSRFYKETTLLFQWISCKTLARTLFWVRNSCNATKLFLLRLCLVGLKIL